MSFDEELQQIIPYYTSNPFEELEKIVDTAFINLSENIVCSFDYYGIIIQVTEDKEICIIYNVIRGNLWYVMHFNIYDKNDFKKHFEKLIFNNNKFMLIGDDFYHFTENGRVEFIQGNNYKGISVYKIYYDNEILKIICKK